MKTDKASNRRQFVVAGAAALVAIPIVAVPIRATAATNAALRTSLKYQDTPNGDKSCSGCLQFVPGKTPTALGGCKIIAGDTEISPKGYCVAWAPKAK